MCKYNDDSVCEENNYVGKEMPVPCIVCKEKNPIQMEGCVYGCHLQNSRTSNSSWTKGFVTMEEMYKSCPLPKEHLRCASCGTVLEPTDKYTQLVDLQIENAKLKTQISNLNGERDFLNKRLGAFGDNIEELLIDLRGRNKENRDLQSENDKLKAENDTITKCQKIAKEG